MQYQKRRDISHLRVIFSTSFSGNRDVQESCKSFSVWFNGDPCQNPAPISWITYSQQAVKLVKAATSKAVIFSVSYSI